MEGNNKYPHKNDYRVGFTSGESKIIGLKFMSRDGQWHFSPSPEYINQYLDAYIDAQKIIRPVSKITKELQTLSPTPPKKADH